MTASRNTASRNKEPGTAGPGPRAEAGGEKRRWRRLSQLGLDSIGGRYIYLATAFIVFVILAAWVVQILVNDAAARAKVNIGEREQISRLLMEDIAHEVWTAETALNAFMLVPDPKKRAAVLENLDEILTDIPELAGRSWFKRRPQARAQLEALAEDIRRLRQESARVMEIRVDAERLYPAMPIMLERMLPHNEAFYTGATLARVEADELKDRPEQIEIHRLFSEARHYWSLMIGAFRNWVANRFGFFGDPETAMKAQAYNLSLYAEAVRERLDKLRNLERAGKLGFQQAESLATMLEAERAWHEGYRQVADIMNSVNWRTDQPILRDVVQMLFARIWDTVRALQADVSAAAAVDVDRLTRNADRLSRAVWMLAALSVVVTAVGFVIFEHTVRRPIARVARALKAEAEGEKDVEVPEADTVEIRDLVEAFEHMHRQIQSRQQRLQSVLDNAAEGIITFDEHGVIDSFNPAAERLFGYKEREARGKDLGLIIPPQGRDRRKGYAEHFVRTEVRKLIGHEGEVLGRHKDGTCFPMALKVSRMILEGKPMYTGLVADISERKAMLEHLQDMAERDGLTGLYNRSYFQQELARVVERCRRKDLRCTLLYIDLDNFKYINDTLGHAAGDRLLTEVANLLLKRARKSDLVARFGGDEFTALLYDTPGDVGIKVAESFRNRLAQHTFRHRGEQVDIYCSIGVTEINARTESADEALSHADVACHLAKRGGRNQIRLFNPEDQADVDTMSLDMGWSRRIKEAIDHGRFALACQPIVNTRTREIDCYEVLVRMCGEGDELIMPSGFMPAAERFGLIKDIDKWVIVHAVATLAEQRKTLPRLRYSINLSSQTLADVGICELIRHKLEETGLEPAALTFEVTETVAISDMSVATKFLSRLREIGCRTALDDFGSGMASFAYLRDLPVDIVKIDGRFVKKLADNAVDQAMVRAMNEIAHTLGKQTIAEFVETEEAFRLLVEFGVDYAQGYHLGRPDVVFPCKEIARLTGVPKVCNA